ncbi:MAG: hypothetical protein IPM23_20340 [Candidatus Melainabacteria bacterium]|nr:hypothetical protein [Candidatus Melainabacteria bacterium]
MNTQPEVNHDPVDLDGLDSLLTEAHVEVVEPENTQVPRTQVYYETRTMLKLLSQVQEVHEMLRETNGRLTRAYARLKQMEQVVRDQEQKIAMLPAFQKQAERAIELQNKLDEALAEIEKLRQPWWHRIANTSHE